MHGQDRSVRKKNTISSCHGSLISHNILVTDSEVTSVVSLSRFDDVVQVLNLSILNSAKLQWNGMNAAAYEFRVRCLCYYPFSYCSVRPALKTLCSSGVNVRTPLHRVPMLSARLHCSLMEERGYPLRLRKLC